MTANIHTPRQLLEAFAGQEVLIVGDVMLDRYLRGDVRRISPEAPVPVVHLEERSDHLGGAANVAINIAALGGHPILCSVVGQDVSGQELLKLMEQQGMTVEGMLCDPTRPTTVKTRVMAQHQHLLRVDEEVTHAIDDQISVALLKRVRQVLEQRSVSVMLLQDYNKGVLHKGTIDELLQLARDTDLPVAVDPKVHNFFAYQGVSVFKPNLREMQAQVPFEIRVDLDSLQQASEWLRSRLGHRHSIITLGEHGIFIQSQGQTGQVLPTFPRDIADVCGAGDTVISVVALGMALDAPLTVIATLSNLAGGQVCENAGVVAIDRDQLLKETLSMTVTTS